MDAALLLRRVYLRTFRIAAGVGTTLVFGFHTLPHIFPKKTLHVSSGIPCDVYVPDERYEKLLRETCAKMNVDSNKIQLFYNSGLNTVSAGCLFFPNVSMIGLPRTCMFKTHDDIRSSNIMFKNIPVDWDSSVGRGLQDVFMLSDEHVQFLIGHELTHIKEMDFIKSTVHSTGCFYGFYKASIYVPSLLKERPLGRLVLLHSIICLFGCVVYKHTNRLLNRYLEYHADEQSARLEVVFCEGGISYMRNRLKLNRILRKMHCGSEGEELYSKVGNNLKGLDSHPKRTDRLKKLKQIKIEYDTNTASDILFKS